MSDEPPPDSPPPRGAIVVVIYLLLHITTYLLRVTAVILHWLLSITVEVIGSDEIVTTITLYFYDY